MSLVEIAPPAYSVDLEIAYATSNNFTSAPVYSRPGCYLHEVAAHHLRIAIDLAQRQGLRLKIFDAFRPSEAQWVLWNHTPDPEFLADPQRGSPHSRGVAVDLTLVDAAGGALDMGTGFDEFSVRSHHGSSAISVAAERNRFLLLGLMTTAGWDFYRNEWWHYHLPDAGQYPLFSDTELPEPMMPPAKRPPGPP